MSQDATLRYNVSFIHGNREANSKKAILMLNNLSDRNETPKTKDVLTCEQEETVLLKALHRTKKGIGTTRKRKFEPLNCSYKSPKFRSCETTITIVGHVIRKMLNVMQTKERRSFSQRNVC